MTDTTNRPMTPSELNAMFEAVDNAELAREDRRLQAERRRSLIVDYLLAAEEAEEDPGRAKALTDAREALAGYLVAEGEYETREAAAEAIEARRVWAMPKPHTEYEPDGFTPRGLEVPF